MSVHAHIRMIEIMYKVGLKKECLKNSFLSHSMGLFRFRYGKCEGYIIENFKDKAFFANFSFQIMRM